MVITSITNLVKNYGQADVIQDMMEVDPNYIPLKLMMQHTHPLQQRSTTSQKS